MNNTALWVLQGFLAVAFLYSGIMKSTKSECALVAMGQTGVEGKPLALIRFIGITELLGVAGLILPVLLNILPVLTPVSALCFAVIMLLAAPIHHRRHEPKSAALNIVLLICCLIVAWGRFKRG